MIYNKDAAFPYPVLSHTSSSYENNDFEFNVDTIKETKETYIFPLSYTIGSSFIEQLILEKKATLVLIVQSGDNYFEELSYNQKEIVLPKNRLSLSKRTRLQLHIQTLETIDFSMADDLSNFYAPYKSDIRLKRHTLLGYSNEVVFEGSEVKPLDIFEQSIKENLTVPFEVKITNETILLLFRDRESSLEVSDVSNHLRNMYFYIGLNRALTEFINVYGNDEEFIDLTSLPVMEKGLHEKLKDLMISKNIKELDPDNLDETIQSISDDIIEKYIEGVKGMIEDGN